jgi:adenine-specific DNA-methyltransferase
MPTLNWIGKEAVINHDKEVPFRLLKKVKYLSVEKNSQNLIIHGDNLEALKSLMPYYQGKIKCIYIDPPYNTGNEGWVYSDKVSSPKIKKWLGKVVGGESEDLCRHDKWLCMMYPRLKLLKELLSESGIIFVSIDDSEITHLRNIMDEIFDEKNFIAQIIWHRKRGKDNSAKYFSRVHEYLLVYAKDSGLAEIKRIELEEGTKKAYRNPDNDPRGRYRLLGAWARGTQGGSKYSFVSRTGKKFSERLWLVNKETMQRYDKENRLVFIGDKVYRKLFLSEHSGAIPETIWLDTSNAANASDEIKDIFGEQIFETPKPTPLIKRVVQISTEKDSIILDSFAGTGTTANAVMQVNKEDSGERKFILIEMEDKVAKDITAERVKRVIKKYEYNDGFEYCELDKPLFNEDGQIEDECQFEQLATYIYFTETQTNIERKIISGNFIGEYGETEYYLIFKQKGKNVLNKDFLKRINKNSKKKVVYADKCLIDDKTLEKSNILFKQIPYEVKVY